MVLMNFNIIKQISWTTVQRFLKCLDLKPHRMDYYLFCEDPELLEKAKIICDLYINPPRNRVLLSYDERTGIQAIERTKIKNMIPGYPAKREFEYKRHGHMDLLAIFEISNGEVFGVTYEKHRQIEFLDFMKQVRKRYRGRKLTIIMDNLQSHKTPAVKKWLDGQKGMVEFIFTPKHASWLNQIEVWFKELNQKCIRRSSVTSKEEMSENILNWIMTYNKHYAHPYNWEFNGILKKHEEKAA